VLLVPLLMLVKFNETIVAFQSEILVVLGVVVQLKLVVMLLFQVVLLVLGVMVQLVVGKVQLVVDKVQLVVDKVQFMVGMVVLVLHDGKVLLVVLGVDELVELDDDELVDGNSVLRIKLHSKFSRFQSNELNSSLFQVSQLGRLMLTVGYDEVVVLELLVMDKVLTGHADESGVEVLEYESVEKGLGRL